jgi:hypothetical protein
LATQVPTTKTYTTPFASLSTANPGDDGQSNAEPTSTGGYAAQSISWSAISTPSNDASAIAQNSVAISWGPSSAAYSTGATNLTYVGIWNNVSTRTEAAFLGRAQIAVPQAVNSAGITLTIAIGGLQMGCISGP